MSFLGLGVISGLGNLLGGSGRNNPISQFT